MRFTGRMSRVEALQLAREISEQKEAKIPVKIIAGRNLQESITPVLISAITLIQLIEAHKKAKERLWKCLRKEKGGFNDQEIEEAKKIVAKSELLNDVLISLKNQLIEMITGYESKVDKEFFAKQTGIKLFNHFLNPDVILNKDFPNFFLIQAMPSDIFESLFGMLSVEIDISAASMSAKFTDFERKSLQQLLEYVRVIDNYPHQVFSLRDVGMNLWPGFISNFSSDVTQPLETFMDKYNEVKFSKTVAQLFRSAYLKPMIRELVDNNYEEFLKYWKQLNSVLQDNPYFVTRRKSGEGVLSEQRLAMENSIAALGKGLTELCRELPQCSEDFIMQFSRLLGSITTWGKFYVNENQVNAPRPDAQSSVAGSSPLPGISAQLPASPGDSGSSSSSSSLSNALVSSSSSGISALASVSETLPLSPASPAIPQPRAASGDFMSSSNSSSVPSPDSALSSALSSSSSGVLPASPSSLSRNPAIPVPPPPVPRGHSVGTSSSSSSNSSAFLPRKPSVLLPKPPPSSGSSSANISDGAAAPPGRGEALFLKRQQEQKGGVNPSPQPTSPDKVVGKLPEHLRKLSIGLNVLAPGAAKEGSSRRLSLLPSLSASSAASTSSAASSGSVISPLVPKSN